MQATRFRLLAHGCALLTIAFASCDDSDDAVGNQNSRAGNTSSCVACAGEAAGGNGEAGSGPSSGGKQALLPTAESGTAGADNTAGGAGGAPPEGPVLEELKLCDRLTRVDVRNRDTIFAFELSMLTDCQVKWLSRLYLDAGDRHEFANALEDWNDRFWGCQDVPVGDFGLVWGTPAMSQGDAEIVIGHYLTAAIEHLDLTLKEEGEMRAALARLSTLVITSASLEPSRPACDASGGAGGIAGTGGAAGGGEGGLGGAAGTAGASEGGAAGGFVSGNGGAP